MINELNEFDPTIKYRWGALFCKALGKDYVGKIANGAGKIV